MMRTLVKSQIWLSEAFDKLLPEKYRIDGNQDFIESFVHHEFLCFSFCNNSFASWRKTNAVS
ncbi:hypothetical protein THIOM_005731 [Candidatus Thiomargarita nelsonii]|uniref:Uncharacterized protein n=1 Tax=Candidatus Thiomargarita nelsonii TaxID=1003181 RepID=A0A176RSE2_9GAMM|nr:hypothetical protein THIOM_005731 [Candidatus Thiomargarita nelsonii]